MFRKETDAVSVTKPKIVHTNENTLPCVEEEEVSEEKNDNGSILRRPFRHYLKGNCTRSLCEYWHPPECQFYKSETSCKAGDMCLFPHYKFDEQPNE